MGRMGPGRRRRLSKWERAISAVSCSARIPGLPAVDDLACQSNELRLLSLLHDVEAYYN